MGKQPIVMIKDLKKNDLFKFNHTVWRVTKKYRNDDSPLKATDNDKHFLHEHLFHNEELEVEKL